MSPPKHSADSPRPDSAHHQQSSRGAPVPEQGRHGHRESTESFSSGQRDRMQQRQTSEQQQQQQQQHQHQPPSAQDVAQQEPSSPAPASEPTEAELQPSSSSFRPFFALIKDTNKGQYLYPSVRYIFSDDDTDLLRDASFLSLESGQHDTTEHAPHPSTRRRNTAGSAPEERFILVDVEPTATGDAADQGGSSNTPSTEQTPSGDTQTERQQQQQQRKHQQQRNLGYRVLSANSLTPTWAVQNAELNEAPTFDSFSNSPPSTQQDEQSPVGGVMLTIEGTSGLDNSATGPPAGTAAAGAGGGGGGGTGKQKQQPAGQHRTPEEILEQIEKGLNELKRVVEASDPTLVSEDQPNREEPKEEEWEQEEEQEQRQDD